MEKQARLACIASGSGTDFYAIATAWERGEIPEVSDIFLLSTNKEAGCIEKSKALSIPCTIIDHKDALGVHDWNRKINNFLVENKIDLTFLVGCIHFIDPDDHMYNIHPADPHKHGGKGMYGLKVHEHVLAEILDEINRGMKVVDDQFYTLPTVHAVIKEYDRGRALLQAHVPIPISLVKALYQKEITLTQAAEELQKVVLPIEWKMLPAAVRIAASLSL